MRNYFTILFCFFLQPLVTMCSTAMMRGQNGRYDSKEDSCGPTHMHARTHAQTHTHTHTHMHTHAHTHTHTHTHTQAYKQKFVVLRNSVLQRCKTVEIQDCEDSEETEVIKLNSVWTVQDRLCKGKGRYAFEVSVSKPSLSL